MNKGQTRNGVRVACVLAALGMICALIAGICLVMCPHPIGIAIATPFVWLWFLCSFPLGILAVAQTFDRPPLFLLLVPLTLLANAMLWGFVVAGFSKLKRVGYKKLEKQNPH